MNELRDEYKQFLFNKHFLVMEKHAQHVTLKNGYSDSKLPRQYAESDKFVGETLLSLSKLYGIRITEGHKNAQPQMLEIAGRLMGNRVPEAFYRGFPKSVRNLPVEKRYFDQLISYFVTYGMDDFSSPRYSIFETKEDMERTIFSEDGVIKDFSIITCDEAVEKLKKYVEEMCASSRPIPESSMEVVKLVIRDFGFHPKQILSKNTAVHLLVSLNDPYFSKFLTLSDGIKVMEEVHFLQYGFYRMDDRRFHTNKLNMKNRYRKILTKMLDDCFSGGRVDIGNCYEKKKTWAGLLHHIHYKAKTPQAHEFLSAMRGKENHSAYSAFEKSLKENGAFMASGVLLQAKGPGALLRNLNYLISRAKSEEEMNAILDRVLGTEVTNPIILLQLYSMYCSRKKTENTRRTFMWVKCNVMRIHTETEEEAAKCRSRLSDSVSDMLQKAIFERLKAALSGRLSRVYIHPDMERFAVPLKESASQGGFGVLASGSRVPIGEAKKIRGFTYWERVDDIDLSVIGICDDGTQVEFSWRTMAENQSNAITYSGDETSGYKGGAEYYDIVVDEFRKIHPNCRYLVFCDNVFSSIPFSLCTCRAGYMVRDLDDSGQIFEPKAVASSFTVNAPARFAYLFGIDLQRNDLVWMNMGRDADCAIAGSTYLGFLVDKFFVTDYMNLKILFTLLSAEVVSDPSMADVAVVPSGVDVSAPKIIHEYDFETILAFLEKKPPKM